MKLNSLIGCWRLDKFSLLNAHYAFVDTEEYLADQLFVQHRVRVNFGSEYSSSEHKYRIIMCSCRKKDVPAFEEAIQECAGSRAADGKPRQDHRPHPIG